MSDNNHTFAVDFLGLPMDACRNLFTVGLRNSSQSIGGVCYQGYAPFGSLMQPSRKADFEVPLCLYDNSSINTERKFIQKGLNQIAIDLNSSLNYDYWMCSAYGQYFMKQSEVVEEKKVSIKDRLITTKNLDGRAERLLKLLNKWRRKDQIIIYGRPKYSAKRTQLINTRSRYIGVTKNGKAWQALISINGRKTYLGTYADQQKAAVAFDFHSILIKDYSAMTNFNYTKQNVYDMLNHFSSNNGEFDADSYISKFRPQNIN